MVYKLNYCSSGLLFMNLSAIITGAVMLNEAQTDTEKAIGGMVCFSAVLFLAMTFGTYSLFKLESDGSGERTPLLSNGSLLVDRREGVTESVPGKPTEELNSVLAF